MGTFISGGYVGKPHAHLTGCPGGGNKLVQQPVRDRLRVKLPPVNGSRQWGELHRRALAWTGGADTAWMAAFRQRVPCGECRKHWDALVAKSPPDWANYFAWTVERHNEVNTRIGKPVVALEDARKIWWPA